MQKELVFWIKLKYLKILYIQIIIKYCKKNIMIYFVNNILNLK